MGDPNVEKIPAFHVERVNATTRLKRFNRLMLAFSK
jgi:hypothetical protein